MENINDTLFNYLRNVIYEPENASLDIEKLPEDFQSFGSGLLYFVGCVMETKSLAHALSKGILNSDIPSSQNEIAAPLKSLQASLKHLTWQTQQIAQGYYQQRVEFMGEFSKAFNAMAEQLEERYNDEEREKLILSEANKIKSESLNTLEVILNSLEAKIFVTVPETCEILFINNYMKQNYNLGDDSIGKICYTVLQKGKDEKCEFCPCHKLDKKPDEIIIWDEKSNITNITYRNADRYIIWPDGRRVHLQFSIDITEIIAARELAERSSRAKDDFLAKMSHEIRTPMNAIIGMTELALREDMSNAAREHILTVKQAGVNLLSIVNDILDFSKIESGTMSIVPTDYRLSSLLNDVINIIKMRAIDSLIRFVVNIDSNLPLELVGDKTRIRQILINILGNAVKYTEKGYVSLSVSGEHIDDENIKLIMEIKDSGRGIRNEDICNLFNEYTQFDSELNRGIEGVGLGLTITQGLLNVMGGEIKVESEYGKGSSFTVTLPQKVHNPEKLASIENSAEKNAIVYERREIYAGSICYTITNLGVRCKLVTNNDEFCEMLRTETYSFIFISNMLFEINKASILKHGKTSQIVLLSEFGESIPVGNWHVLSMPAHVISVANICNGVSDNFSYHSNKELTARFIAPDAKALIVDDIKTNLKVANGLLLPYMMEVDLCGSGRAAIEAIKSKRYDIVFMDHRMPEMDGVEATERIRSFGDCEAYYKNVPIIALTANAITGMKEMFLQNGFDDYLSKPIDTIKLNTILEKWIPKDKQSRSTADNARSINVNRLFTDEFTVEGLDIKKGVHLSGVTTELYFEILAVFYGDGFERINEIKKCIETGNWPSYTIHVHAMKSALANIGAEKLSEAAYNLEMAGRRGDIGFIKTNNDHFLTMLERLLDSIDNKLISHGASCDTSEHVENELINSELTKLKNALGNMNAGEINRTIDSLMSFTCANEIKNVIRKISQHISMVEYEEADSLIESLIAMLSD